MADLRSPTSATHQRGNFCVWWFGAVCDQLLRGAANLPHRLVLEQAGLADVLGLERRDRLGSDYFAHGSDPEQGIRRADLADCPVDHGGLGVLCDCVLRYR